MNQPNEIWVHNTDVKELNTFGITDDAYIHCLQKDINNLDYSKYLSEPFVNEMLEAKNTEIAKLKAKIEELTSDPKKQPPTLEEFMAYAKTLQPYRPELNFALEAKYEAWMDNKWKDGFNKPIKNWKSKLKNTITMLKPTYTNTIPDNSKSAAYKKFEPNKP